MRAAAIISPFQEDSTMYRISVLFTLACILAAAGCTFEAGDGGYVFKPPKEDTVSGELPPDPGPDLGQACFDFFACILTISAQGGSIYDCAGQAPQELNPYLMEIESCQNERCNDLKYDPESENFVPAAFQNCLKYNCPEALISCFAHADNDEGCKRYALCEMNCSDGGVSCDFECMAKLSEEDVPSTVEYLACMAEFIEIPDLGIKEKLCECLAICDAPYGLCDE